MEQPSERQIKWDEMTPEEKKRQLYLEQKQLLQMFVKRSAITKRQYDKSLHDLTSKMGMEAYEAGVKENGV